MVNVFFAFLILLTVPPLQKAEPGLPRDEFEESLPDTPLPPGMAERVFIHSPRTHRPNHLGTCLPTTDDARTEYALAGWHLPVAGLKWKLNPSLVPSANGLTPKPSSRLRFKHG